MSERYFEPRDVEALIPALTEIVDSLRRTHAAASEIRDRVKQEQQRITMSGGAIFDRAEWRASTEALERHAAEFNAGVERISAMGGVVKDLSLGLVDFPHLLRGRVVNLCWKYGEREIRYWHGLDEGFAARKPLERGQE